MIPIRHTADWFSMTAEEKLDADQLMHVLQATSPLPDPGSGKSWFREMDTSAFLEAAGNTVIPGTEEKIGGDGMTYGLGPRAVLLLVAK